MLNYVFILYFLIKIQTYFYRQNVKLYDYDIMYLSLSIKYFEL